MATGSRHLTRYESQTDRDTTYERVQSTWQQLCQGRPLAAEELTGFLAELAELDRCCFLRRWRPDEKSKLSSPARFLSVVDFDGNQHSELLILCGGGEVRCLRGPDSGAKWEVMASGELPAEARPVLGIELEYRHDEDDYIPRVHTGSAEDSLPDQTFEVRAARGSKLELSRCSERGPRRPLFNRMVIGNPAEEPADGLVRVNAVRYGDTAVHAYALRLSPLAHRPKDVEMHFRPGRLAYTSQQVWLADRRENLYCWRWCDGELKPDPEWTDLVADGRITALALWGDGGGEWWVLAATERRQLLIADRRGRLLDRISTPSVIIAMAPNPAARSLWLAYEDGELELLEPIWAPLRSDPLPTFEEALRKIPEGQRTAILREWLESDVPAKAGAAVLGWISLRDGGRPEPDLQGILPATEDRSPEAWTRILEILEAEVLTAPADSPLVGDVLSLARALYPCHHFRLRPYIDQLAARLGSRFLEPRDRTQLESHGNGDYVWLSGARKRDDADHAQDSFDLALERPDEAVSHVTAALHLFAEILTYRHQMKWLFSAARGLCAFTPLPGAAQVLVTNRNGDAFCIDLEGGAVRERWPLPEGTSPCAIAVGPLADPEIPSLVLATDRRQIFLLESTEPGLCLGHLREVLRIDHDLTDLALIPQQGAEPPGILSSGPGFLMRYRGRGGSWEREEILLREVGWIPSLLVEAIEPGEPPRILAGGALHDGRGMLDVLHLDGRREQRIHFPEPVLDLKTVTRPTGAKAIAVACADGHLYLRERDGRCLWRHRVGREASSLAVFDVDQDGREEIIVGGEEGDGNTVMVFDLRGTVLWVLHHDAPVTHVAVTRDANGPSAHTRILIGDLDQRLRVVDFHPPFGPREGEIRERAKRCLEYLAHLRNTRPEALLGTWLETAPTPALRCYAFECYGEWIGSGRSKPRQLQQLLAIDVRPAEEIEQRAYARALVDSVTAPQSPPGALAQVSDRLRDLLRDPVAGHPVGVTALRRLVLRHHRQAQNLAQWLPLLQDAASLGRPEVCQSALNALAAMGPNASEPSGKLPLETWQVMRSALEGQCGKDQWVQENVAYLVRDAADTPLALWELVHRVLVELDSYLLMFVGKAEPRLIASADLATAIRSLALMSDAAYRAKVEDTARHLGELTTAYARIAPPPQAGGLPLDRLYRQLGNAFRVANHEELDRFLTGRGLAELSEQIEELNARDGRRSATLREAWKGTLLLLRELPGSDDLPKYISELTRRADRLLNLAIQTSRPPEEQRWVSPLFAALAGLLWEWSRHGGVLTDWHEKLTQPADPELDFIAADLRQDEILVEVQIRNPGRLESLEYVDLVPSSAQVTCAGLELACRLPWSTPIAGLTIDPLGHHNLRLYASLSAKQRAVLARDGREEIGAELQIEVRHFKPEHHGIVQKPLSCPFQLRLAADKDLDWERHLASSWKRIESDLQDTFASPPGNAVLLECASLARRSLLERLRSTTGTQNTVTIDLKHWAQLYKPRGQSIDASNLLAWISEQIWQEADEHIARMRTTRSPWSNFEELTRRYGPPRILLFNNLERLLIGIARRPGEWNTFDQIIPRVFGWAKENEIRLLFIGTYLAERIFARRWPEIAAELRIIRCDHIGLDDPQRRAELVKATAALLAERKLVDVLNRLPGVDTAAKLVELCGGYLHVLGYVALPALEALRKSPEPYVRDGRKYIIDYANQENFFNLLWMQQDFFERIATVLTAHAETALERTDQAEPGLILSRDYRSRKSAKGSARRAAKVQSVLGPVILSAGTVLDEDDVLRIKTNRSYQSGDAWVRGFFPHRRPLDQQGVAGRLFVDLLRVVGIEQILNKLVEGRVLCCRQSRAFGKFYESAVPLYEEWLRSRQILKHMTQATQGLHSSWYPSELANDFQPGKPGARHLLFPDRRVGNAARDLPLSEMLIDIDRQLDSQTRPLFFRLYGLVDRATETWDAILKLAKALHDCSDSSSVVGHESAQLLFASLEKLLGFKIQHRFVPSESGIVFDSLPEVLAWTYAELTGLGKKALRKKMLFFVARDGAALALRAKELHAWAGERSEEIIEKEEREEGREDRDPQYSAKHYDELRRSVAICFILDGEQDLEMALAETDGETIIVLIDIATLTEIVIESDPGQKVMDRAFKIAGRHRFSPYEVAGSLQGGSRVFVGRESEVQEILSSIDRQDHAILGSRRIGKTSLLAEVAHRLNKAPAGRRVLTLRIELLDGSNVSDAYEQLRKKLRGAGHDKLAERLQDPPKENYDDLHEVISTLATEYGHPVVILMDEVDGLYHWDYRENRGFFQFLRNRLAQGERRLATFVMTGFRYIYFRRFDHSSAFHNFCKFKQLFGVNRQAVQKLVKFLEECNLKLRDEERIVESIADFTFAIPFFVQESCDKLLAHAHRHDLDAIGPDDIPSTLVSDIQEQLKKELWYNLGVDALLEILGIDRFEGSFHAADLKIRCLLLATLLNLYEDPTESSLRPRGRRIFTARQAIEYFHGWYPIENSPWQPDEDEVHLLFSALTMTLAISPVEGEEKSFFFPDDILPTILFKEYPSHDELLVEFERIFKKLENSLTADLEKERL